MELKFVAVRKPRAARFACCSKLFMVTTEALERLSVMPRTEAAARSVGQLLEWLERPRLFPL